jgi:hypothetical protein
MGGNGGLLGGVVPSLMVEEIRNKISNLCRIMIYI